MKETNLKKLREQILAEKPVFATRQKQNVYENHIKLACIHLDRALYELTNPCHSVRVHVRSSDGLSYTL